MSWYMNDERKLLQQAFREFAQTRVRPYVDKMEKEDADAKELLLEMGKLGFFRLGKPEAYGGTGADQIPVALLMEELGKESHGVALLAMTQHLFLNSMFDSFSDEQLKKYAVPLMNGECVFADACTEPTGASFTDGYKTMAVQDGDEWVINGNKCLITLVGVADYYVVVCATGDKRNVLTGEGFASFVIPAGTEGLKPGHIERKAGWHGSKTGTVYFDNVRVPAAWKTEKPFGFSTNYLGAWYAAFDLGGAEKCVDITTEILKGRIQEGGLSIWDAHEAARNNVAELVAKIRVFKHALYSFMQDWSEGQHDYADDCALKMEGTKLLQEVSSECAMLAGGMGCVYETGIERYYRDVLQTGSACGSNKSMLSIIAAFL